MADTEQVDNEINLEQLKVLKEVFEVGGASNQKSAPYIQQYLFQFLTEPNCWSSNSSS